MDISRTCSIQPLIGFASAQQSPYSDIWLQTTVLCLALLMSAEGLVSGVLMDPSMSQKR
jgi:hypothetical protein